MHCGSAGVHFFAAMRARAAHTRARPLRVTNRGAYLTTRGFAVTTALATAPVAQAAAAVAPSAAPAATVAGSDVFGPGLRSVVLYQYDSCPFCNRVRAYLDYARIPYTVVEVNPLLKSELSWSGDYKKVPVAVINGVRVVDSTCIIDMLEMLLRRSAALGSSKSSTPDGLATVRLSGVEAVGHGTQREAERRAWVDARLVRLLSPNIYRTLPEAWQVRSKHRVMHACRGLESVISWCRFSPQNDRPSST